MGKLSRKAKYKGRKIKYRRRDIGPSVEDLNVGLGKIILEAEMMGCLVHKRINFVHLPINKTLRAANR